MPIYEYKCPECATVSEFILKFSDPAPTECPACGKTVTMTKQMSATNFHLKGGGWYKDKYDSASNKPPSEGAGSSGSSASSSTGAASSSETGAKSSATESAPAKSPEKKASPKPSAKPSSSES